MAACLPAGRLPTPGDVYLGVLGIKLGPLRGGVDSSGQPTLRTSDGMPITALRADRYTIVVTDASRSDNFTSSARA